MSVLRVIIGTGIAASLGMAIGGGVLFAAHDAREDRGRRPPRSERPPLAANAGGAQPAALQAATTASAGAAGVAPAAAASGFVPTAARPVERFTLGLNEAVAIPGKVIAQGRFGPGWVEQQLAKDAAAAVEVGARLVRSHTGAYPRNSWHAHQTETDATAHADGWVRAVQKAGLEPVMMVSPWPGNRTANATDRYVPDDMASYTAYVTATVERYDGDGVDDMPGLTGPIRYWEVDNEPDLKFTMPPRDAVREVKPGTFCSPAEAATVLVASSKAIKAAYPDALVMNGGLYRPAHDAGRAYLRDLWAQPGVPAAVDVVALHNYASDESGELHARALSNARAIVGSKVIFLTETSVASEGEKPFMTEEWQARMVATFVGRSAAAGVHALLWHTLSDPPPTAKHNGGFSRHSLFRQLEEGGAFVEKPAAAVYRNLSARLAADDLLGATEIAPGAVQARSGAVLLYEGTRLAKTGGFNLRTGEKIAPGATASAPAWLLP